MSEAVEVEKHLYFHGYYYVENDLAFFEKLSLRIATFHNQNSQFQAERCQREDQYHPCFEKCIDFGLYFFYKTKLAPRLEQQWCLAKVWAQTKITAIDFEIPIHTIFGTLCACYTIKWWKGLSMYWLLMEQLIAIPSTMHSSCGRVVRDFESEAKTKYRISLNNVPPFSQNRGDIKYT